MTTMIVYGHPWEKSFNHAVLSAVEEGLQKKSRDYVTLDLYQDGFEPRYTAEELAGFSAGLAKDPLVKKYQQLLTESDKIIFIFPVWWNDVPSIIKGFLDKVFLKEFAYIDTPRGVKGKLNHISEAVIITTSSSPAWYLKHFSGNAIKKVFMKTTLKSVGIKRFQWFHLGAINRISDEKRGEFLEMIEKTDF